MGAEKKKMEIIQWVIISRQAMLTEEAIRANLKKVIKIIRTPEALLLITLTNLKGANR